jgi:hypothetical protein
MGHSTTASGADSTAMGYASTASGAMSVAMGNNSVASGHSAVAMGAFNKAAGDGSTALGSNSFATGSSATAIGELTEASAMNSFATGSRAKATHMGAFVWADASSFDDFVSTSPNEFALRARGGMRVEGGSSYGIALNPADRPLITRGHDPFTSGNNSGAGRWGLFMEPHTLVAGIPAIANKTFRVWSYNADSTMNRELLRVDQAGSVTATTFNPTSDRDAKENFSGIDPQAVLEKVAALPISRWNFKQDPAAEHLGPMAQDFHEAFGLGTDNKHIATVDADGVALAAIQGLNRKLEEKNAALEREVAGLKALVQELADKVNGGAK